MHFGVECAQYLFGCPLFFCLIFLFLSVIATINSATANSPIVVISQSSHQQDIQRALQARATSYIPKTIGTQELIYGLKRILAGTTYMPAQLLEQVVDSSIHGYCHPAVPDALTQRQQDVLQLLSQGLANKGIARKLKISEGTVKLHVSAIIQTLGVRNRTEAALAVKSTAA
jgi:DNA-binding NarL/FixJ family response regulator